MAKPKRQTEKAAAVSAPMSTEPKIATNEIIRSKTFRKAYQQDMLKAVLKEPYYTVSEAKQVLDAYFNGKVGT